MFKSLILYLDDLAVSKWYWLIYITGGIALIVSALFYQYALEELPCVMCIQVRLWLSLLIIVAAVGLMLRHIRIVNYLAQIPLVLIAIALTERSYQLLGTERGFVFGDCGFNLGMPEWFAIEEWLPSIFRVETSCGYTPEIIFGITIAEALMVISVCLLLLSVSVFMSSIVRHKLNA